MIPSTITTDGAGKSNKGRTFKATLLYFVTADRFWTGSTRSAYRPALLSFCGTDQAVRALAANLRTGRPASIRNQHGYDLPKPLEFTRAMGAKWSFRKVTADATIATAYMPSLCDLDPAYLQQDISFLWAPPSWWVEQQLANPMLAEVPVSARREAVLGASFCAFLDKRSPYPIVPDLNFQRRLYLACREQDWYLESHGSVSVPGPFFVYPDLPNTSTGACPMVGHELVRFVCAEHKEFEEILQAETARFFREEKPSWLYRPEPAPQRPAVDDLDPLTAISYELAAEALRAERTAAEAALPVVVLAPPASAPEPIQTEPTPPAQQDPEPATPVPALPPEQLAEVPRKSLFDEPENNSAAPAGPQTEKDLDGANGIEGVGRVLPVPHRAPFQPSLFDWT